jgi:ribosomal protein S12 methylthiotransferase accessory factor
MRAPLDDRLAGGAEVALDQIAANAPSSSGDCVRLLARHGLRAIAVDVTTPDIRSQGWFVMRVVVPGLYANAPAAFPLLGGSRLADNLARGALCLLPLPHG